MAEIKSKRGQGLGFIAIIVLIALLYFIFRYNTETYEFVMTAGDHQAHLVTGYVETEKAKFFSETAIRQAAYESALKAGVLDCSEFSSKVCGDKNSFINNISSIFESYILMYEPTLIGLSTDFPGYRFSIKNNCANNQIQIEAFGFGETCYLRSDYPFPKIPCQDLNSPDGNLSACTAVKYATLDQQACSWDGENCTDYYPVPDCNSITDPATCRNTVGHFSTNECRWDTSYSEDINILSAPLQNYQFSINSDAHFIETIDCAGYTKFIETRKNVQAFKPSCTVDVEPATGSNTTMFNFSVEYKGETLNSIDLKVINSTGGEQAISLIPLDSTDTFYLDGKYYNAAMLFTILDTYNATVSCKNNYGDTAGGSKTFKVS